MPIICITQNTHDTCSCNNADSVLPRCTKRAPTPSRMNLQFKAPLRCDDVFVSRLALEKKGLRYIFHQDIYRASDNVMCLKSDVDIVCLINGKLGNSDDYDKAFARFLPNKE